MMALSNTEWNAATINVIFICFKEGLHDLPK